MTITASMMGLLQHTLGLRPDQRTPYRNHFLAGPGHHDMPDLESLEQSGMMKRAASPAFCEPGDVVFTCTSLGKAYAIENLAPLPPEPKRSHYREYLNADSGHSFAEWLGITKPEYEVRRTCGKYEYRMFRRDRSFYQIKATVSGDWMRTKKEAKASYKNALNSLRSN